MFIIARFTSCVLCTQLFACCKQLRGTGGMAPPIQHLIQLSDSAACSSILTPGDAGQGRLDALVEVRTGGGPRDRHAKGEASRCLAFLQLNGSTTLQFAVVWVLLVCLATLTRAPCRMLVASQRGSLFLQWHHRPTIELPLLLMALDGSVIFDSIYVQMLRWSQRRSQGTASYAARLLKDVRCVPCSDNSVKPAAGTLRRLSPRTAS